MLVYCVLEAAGMPLPAGVAGAPVELAQVDVLQLLFSEIDPAALAGDPRQHALQFHAVLAAAFAERAIVSFRFPTVFASREEMAAELGPKAGAVSKFLRDNRDAVQMEIRLIPSGETGVEPSSGTAYLQQRQRLSQQLEQAAAACRAALAAQVRDWRQRPGKDGPRCFALVARDAVGAYRATMTTVALPAGVRAVVSGPWPANEFLEAPA